MILFYTARKFTGSNIPKIYKLYQNYPNPFNPSTKIKFEIKKTSFVNIKLYDITGKSIYVLTDKEYKPGVYEIEFNGANYSSGVYFYSLFADEILIDTKKMILMK